MEISWMLVFFIKSNQNALQNWILEYFVTYEINLLSEQFLKIYASCHYQENLLIRKIHKIQYSHLGY